MKENRVAQNNEILNKRAKFERIPHYNDPYQGSSSSAASLCIKIGAWKL
ncbi:hypothetical protein T08_5062 [Trichinella sp. T8]|nr:hypothetical protein T08_5062 [Trichinella sp. T8]